MGNNSVTAIIADYQLLVHLYSTSKRASGDPGRRYSMVDTRGNQVSARVSNSSYRKGDLGDGDWT
jgi:hypothetical protein